MVILLAQIFTDRVASVDPDIGRFDLRQLGDFAQFILLADDHPGASGQRSDPFELRFAVGSAGC